MSAAENAIALLSTFDPRWIQHGARGKSSYEETEISAGSSGFGNRYAVYDVQRSEDHGRHMDIEVSLG